MAIRNGRLCVFLCIVSLLATLFVFSNSIIAYAINENLIIDEYNGWIDAEVSHTYNAVENGFDGVLKYIEDEIDGCFYLFFKFYDTRVANGKDDNIILTFTVENSISKYKFSVNRDGFINTGQNDINAVNLIYNFENCTCKSMGGEIFVGFELNNKADREQLNYIKCDYASGVDSVTTLFDDAYLDMYVEPTTKADTTKSASTTKKKSTTAKNSTTGKSSDSKTTTKFKASGSITAGKNTKYSANSTAIIDDKSNVDETITEIATEKIVNSQELEMSKPAFSLMIAAFVMAGAGVVVIIIAAVSKEKNNKDNNDNNNDTVQA